MKYEQHKGKQLVNQIEAEDWYESEIIKSNMEFIAWLEENVK